MTTYLHVIGLFAGLSLLSIGGGNTVLPEMHMNVVRREHWLTDAQFADLFAISQTAPGPSILIVALIGYGAGLSAAGVPGAILGGVLATVAMVMPAASLVYVVTLFWQRAQKSRLRAAVEKGFAPLTVGLILATSVVMTRAADHNWRGYLLTALCTIVFLRTSLNPLVVVAAAGLAGALGVV
ncbi:chromate transport protein ChrA [Mycolicibacterium chubuense NBB4]|uniref:Chromate transport protein ChrA n=1 Tax=Mycolicibacterium chubuense (strain NBB4) TaxID=710421 RepID=I4BE67_MYCCN|nr:chromate transporter [Mycolicibacterium chubuense]AFM15574.1 chromate transport protein ChrA [Mycolicibacterium chubuense NBB4]